ncbi:hypothetical protein DRF62_05180 [Chryseobacterium piscium]|uniref:Uncharacterized protein n=2 Tax=Chryseobacterium piscium TaxID=333702 RepID=A0A3D9BQT6_9FLAO|nr:hypothetical protein DRF62_05180 [Chryseobacterium piscium]
MRDEIGEENMKYLLGQIRILKIIYTVSLLIPALILLSREKWYWAISKYAILYFLIIFLAILNTYQVSQKNKIYLIFSLGLINIMLLITYVSY